MPPGFAETDIKPTTVLTCSQGLSLYSLVFEDLISKSCLEMDCFHRIYVLPTLSS